MSLKTGNGLNHLYIIIMNTFNHVYQIIENVFICADMEDIIIIQSMPHVCR